MPILLAFYYAIMRTEELARHSFLWFDLGLADPLYILPIAAAIMTFTQIRLQASLQPPTNQQLALVNNFMPIMILFFAFKLPAALSLYWVVGGLFSIAQTYFIQAGHQQIKETMKS